MREVPNFFIVGAPKSGTSSMYNYLGGHPEIFMSPKKEPHFFAKDLGEFRSCTSEEEYHALFEEASHTHEIIGEASTMYLYSDVALQEIRSQIPDAKILIMLRNPIELVQSFHAHLLYLRHETEERFGRAWNLQAARAEGRHLPRRCKGPSRLQYAEVGKLGSQVRQALEVFPSDQVQLLFFSDFKKDTKEAYRTVLDFLDLQYRGRTEFGRHNSRKKNRMPWLVELFRKKPAWLQRLYEAGTSFLGIQGFGIGNRILERQKTTDDRSKLSPEMHQELRDTFAEDIHKLSEITGRDLSSWLE